jgi:5'-phosphate synthase pdxT subunit
LVRDGPEAGTGPPRDATSLRNGEAGPKGTMGVLALQGAFAEHLAAFRRLGVRGREVRLPRDLEGLAGLVIPGGESTTIGLLAREYGFLEPLKAFGKDRAVWGTCAGAILLSRSTPGETGERLGLLDATVRRNAFGRQVESFRVLLEVPALEHLGPGGESPGDPSFGDGRQPDPGEPHLFPGLFIRAPLIEEVASPRVEVLSRLEDGSIVAVRQGRVLATSFHPELTGDDRFHRYFLTLADG